ncbi:FMN-dependent NADH-azoreductase [Ferrimonas senticii]|uniref:FMN-dependent NADH-azoreductase n=1 Tax=Ferrimonas senticii TaxID=394566 RepID=UPI00041881C7|nr:NAD(P)H-dependent oxidoreductase [Ferrimonas senticii]
MHHVLSLQSSIRGSESHSRQISARLIAQLQSQQPIRHLERDLALAPLPHFSIDTYRGFHGEQDPAASAAAALSDQLIDELLGIDTLIIAAPVYNFSFPTTLKAWFDHIARSGRTFSYREAFTSPLADLQVYVVLTYGGGNVDHIESQLRQQFAMLGVSKIEVIHGAMLDRSDNQQARQQLEQQLQQLSLAPQSAMSLAASQAAAPVAAQAPVATPMEQH